MTYLWWLALALSGCDKEAKFQENFKEDYCSLLTDCEVLDIYGYRSQSDCDEQATGLDEDCSFSDESADTCLEDIEKAGCTDLWEDGLPKSCSLVCSN